MKSFLIAVFFIILPAVSSAGEARQYSKAILISAGSENYQRGTSIYGAPIGDSVLVTSRPVMARSYSIIVGIDDLAYLLEYEAKYAWSKKPIFTVGDPIDVRLDKSGEKMFLLLSDGKELKTKIIQKVRLNNPGSRSNFGS